MKDDIWRMVMIDDGQGQTMDNGQWTTSNDTWTVDVDMIGNPAPSMYISPVLHTVASVGYTKNFCQF